jgi:hypothetical protein
VIAKVCSPAQERSRSGRRSRSMPATALSGAGLAALRCGAGWRRRASRGVAGWRRAEAAALPFYGGAGPLARRAGHARLRGGDALRSSTGRAPMGSVWAAAGPAAGGGRLGRAFGLGPVR